MSDPHVSPPGAARTYRSGGRPSPFGPAAAGGPARPVGTSDVPDQSAKPGRGGSPPPRADAPPPVDTNRHFSVLAGHLASFSPRPDALVVTGDLAGDGEAGSYRFVRSILKTLPFPVYLVPGNHDKRAEMTSLCAEFCPPGWDGDLAPRPFLCGTKDLDDLRLIFLDSVREGERGGGLSPAAGKFLRGALAGRPGVPALVFAHHPPFMSGLEKMDEPFVGAGELAGTLRGRPGASLCCGRLHLGMSARWEGVQSVVCPAVSLDMEPDFNPGGGGAFTAAAPSFVLHRPSGAGLDSHFLSAPGGWPRDGPFDF
ncbi:MAG: metallophosphoesterase [Deltaproteobacteria bacterium]|nr:metallophosphoesterase [Deltaproteobacteria bacterium]